MNFVHLKLPPKNIAHNRLRYISLVWYW